MRVIHITESHEQNAGGISTVVHQLARNAASWGAATDILSVGWDPMPPPSGVGLTNVRPWSIPPSWRWSPRLRKRISDLTQRHPDPRVIHIHGVWLAAQWHGARAARRSAAPFLVSAHGQLEPYHWTDKGRLHYAKKKLYWRLVAYPAFRSARTIHAITLREKAHLGELFQGQPIEVIRNAADLVEIDEALAQVERQGAITRRPVVAFLGRFHPKKGVDCLIRAFGMAGLPSEWCLVLAGPPGDANYMARLERLALASGVRSRISFMGPLTGRRKWTFYRTAAVVAVPSFSEVVGMVNLEAAACGTPTVTTFETGLDDWEDGGGLLIRPNPEDLARALWKICSESADEYLARSTASRRLVEERYCWAVVGPKWEALYASLAV